MLLLRRGAGKSLASSDEPKASIEIKTAGLAAETVGNACQRRSRGLAQSDSRRTILIMPTHTLRLPPADVVRWLRAEMESENGQPDFDLAISKEHITKSKFGGAARGGGRRVRIDVVTEFAVLTVDPHLERDYWVLRVEVEIPLGLHSHHEKAGLGRRDLTLDEFERELNAPTTKQIKVRLETETATSRRHFHRWLLEMRKRHPSRSRTKRLRGTRPRRSTLRVVSPNSGRAASRDDERRLYRQTGRLILPAPRKGSTALVERLLPLARKKLVTLPQDTPFIEAAKLLANKEANLVIICDSDGLIVGVVAKTDIVREICEFRGFGSKISISTAMTREIVSCSPRDFLVDVWSDMKSHGLKHIPIVDHDSRPIGLAIARDVLGLLMEDLEHEEQLLRDYVMCVGYR